MAIKAILFDKDGTLLDYAASWLPVNRRLALFAAAGDEQLAGDLLRACGMDPVSGHVTPDSLLAAGNTLEISQGLAAAGSPLPLKALVAELDRLFAEGAADSVAVTDLARFFASLKARGLKTGIASSDNETSIRNTARRFKFESDLDFVAGYDSGHGCKPDPGMVHGFCAAIGLPPSAVAVVGDNNHDLHMARAAKAGLAIAVLTGTGSRQSLSAAADHVLADITELEALLDAVG